MVEFNPGVHHRRSIRLQGYDYSGAGAYFIAVVTQDRMCLFGEVKDGQVELNDAGKVLQSQWCALPTRFSAVQLDEFIVMPNHVHGIVWLAGSELSKAPGHQSAQTDTALKRAGTSPAPTILVEMQDTEVGLGAIVGAWKSITTDEYIRGVRQCDWQPFRRKLWQRNYWEHIARDEPELSRIREYILGNPSNWGVDKENPQRSGSAPPRKIGLSHTNRFRGGSPT